MKLEYKGKKWDKEVENYQKTLKKTKAINNNELYTIDKFLNDNQGDYLWLFCHLSGNYERMVVYYYLDNPESKEIIKYTYLSGCALLMTKYMYEKGIRTKINRIIENCIAEIDFALFQLIAVDKIENPYIKILDNDLIMLMYHQKYEQAKAILNQLPDDLDESREVYYVSPEFLKKIYIAIIEHDEKGFNEELARRIKKYRRNMVGYSTIVDIVSVALIKMAEREGIHCTVDVIEIPRQFFDGTCKIDKDKDKLPFYDEFLELGII